MIIYHNPRCRTSRNSLEILEKNKCKFEIREYLQIPPSKKELKDILSKLGIKAIDLVRKKETLYIENYKGKELSNAAWIEILSKNPVLIERPIVIDGDKAVIGRPPELVLDLIQTKKKPLRKNSFFYQHKNSNN